MPPATQNQLFKQNPPSFENANTKSRILPSCNAPANDCTRYQDEADKKMASQQETEFDNWLCEKLKSLQLDEDIFLEYLKGVLEEDSSAEEKVGTISGILEGATVS